MTRENRLDSISSFISLVLLALLVACSGASPSGESGNGGGLTQVGGPVGGTGVGEGAQGVGAVAAPMVNPAQPLEAGFPAPGPDPNGAFYYFNFLSSKPLCHFAAKDAVKFKIRGYVTVTPSGTVPEAFVDFLSMGSLRVVDVLQDRYAEIPFGSLMTFDEYGQKTYKLGYVEFTVVSPAKYQFRLFLIPPKSTKALEVPWSTCSDASCLPDPIIKVIAKTPSGDLLNASEDLGVLPICQINGSERILPAKGSGAEETGEE
ncbi:MAG: hypothetical protein K8R69_07785 [Deltaproteobacteria bacterium]|nr:hypothetical protein [Deltaproteobacteria bacterium]